MSTPQPIMPLGLPVVPPKRRHLVRRAVALVKGLRRPSATSGSDSGA
ncbi:hypothetical protein ACEZCY_26780 [Streptacidiphilus sp. N1-12]|uniref:Uncharacterized protein n=2 Tax=Streptacidiphilus alkalitolerans TaxID=3342712 RepID=A0ABV6WL83_9ACTN